MAKRISDEKIALAKQYFRDGWSLPECAAMAGMSLASCKKYLKSTIRDYIDEHTAKAKTKAIANEDEPATVVMTNETDDTPQEMTDSQFISLLEYEFEQVDTYESAKDLYDEYKPQAIINITRVDAFRVIYEKTLNKVISKSNLNEDQDNQSASNADIIETYKKAFGCRIPISKGCNSWSQERLVEHITYWRMKNQYSHKACIQWLEENTDLQTRQQYLNS